MANTKNPLISLDARGSIGQAITYTKRRSQTIAEKKPELPYFLTLPVQYQRWLYADYVALWHQQSQATKDSYRSTGVRFHLTAFQYWMKYHLSNLPDIAGWWKLDSMLGATTPDSSRNTNTATIFGATPATGPISGCASFITNDYLNCGNHSSLDITGDISIEFSVNFINLAPTYHLISKGRDWVNGYETFLDGLGRLSFRTSQLGASRATVSAPGLFATGIWYHIIITRTGINAQIYVDGSEVAYAVKQNHLDPLSGTKDLFIAAREDLRYFADALLDNIIIYNRVLDPACIAKHTLRRWP